MWSRILSTLIACTLVFFTIAGVSAVTAVSSEPPKLEVTDRPLDLATRRGIFQRQTP
jgi:hypothetical protein